MPPCDHDECPPTACSRSRAAAGSVAEYSLYHHPGGFWQLWRGIKYCRPDRMLRVLLPESVAMMQRNGMIQRVGINGMIVKLPNAQD